TVPTSTQPAPSQPAPTAPVPTVPVATLPAPTDPAPTQPAPAPAPPVDPVLFRWAAVVRLDRHGKLEISDGRRRVAFKDLRKVLDRLAPRVDGSSDAARSVLARLADGRTHEIVLEVLASRRANVLLDGEVILKLNATALARLADGKVAG